MSESVGGVDMAAMVDGEILEQVRSALEVRADATAEEMIAAINARAKDSQDLGYRDGARSAEAQLRALTATQDKIREAAGISVAANIEDLLAEIEQIRKVADEAVDTFERLQNESSSRATATRRALRMPADATDGAVLARLEALMDGAPDAEAGEKARECLHSVCLALGLDIEASPELIVGTVVNVRNSHTPPAVQAHAPLRTQAVKSALGLLTRHEDDEPALDDVVILAEYLLTGKVQDTIDAVESTRTRYRSVSPDEAVWTPEEDEKP